MLINILLFVSSDVILTPEQQSVKTTVQNGPRFRTVQTLAAHTRGSVCRASGFVQVGFEEANTSKHGRLWVSISDCCATMAF
jgi:hypothetical protein